MSASARFMPRIGVLSDRMREVRAWIEHYPTRDAFVIARGAKIGVDVVVAEVRAGGASGRGEGTPLYYLNESAAHAAAMIERAADAVVRGEGRAYLGRTMSADSARNALDCALWSLEARRAGTPVWRLAGLRPPGPVTTALTISLGDPGAMERAARSVAARPLLKLKLAGDGGDRERVAAVRRGAPGARLIVDANEAWAELDLEAEARAMAALGVELIEQPVPAGREALLDGVRAAVPWCADESVQTRTELDRVVGRFQVVNIKLDKAGGLTEALALREAARAMGLRVMVGCMLSTSLAIAPALLVAQGAEWVDLDGPLLLARDRDGGCRFDADGGVSPPGPALWA